MLSLPLNNEWTDVLKLPDVYTGTLCVQNSPSQLFYITKHTEPLLPQTVLQNPLTVRACCRDRLEPPLDSTHATSCACRTADLFLYSCQILSACWHSWLSCLARCSVAGLLVDYQVYVKILESSPLNSYSLSRLSWYTCHSCWVELILHICICALWVFYTPYSLLYIFTPQLGAHFRMCYWGED